MNSETSKVKFYKELKSITQKRERRTVSTQVSTQAARELGTDGQTDGRVDGQTIRSTEK